jgi:hypothetical protein
MAEDELPPPCPEPAALAGFRCIRFAGHEGAHYFHQPDDAVEQAVAAEREACALEAESHAIRLEHTSHRDGVGLGWHEGEELARAIAITIRARGRP